MIELFQRKRKWGAGGEDGGRGAASGAGAPRPHDDAR